MSDSESTVMIVFLALSFGAWIIPAVIYTLVTNVRKAIESAHLAALKQSMVEKGMAVEEIERVLRASAKPAEVEDSPVVKLTKKLAEHEVPANVIREILAAFRGAEPSMRRAVVESVVAMLDDVGADTERVLAAVWGLCGSAPAPESRPKDYRFTDEASARHP
jgi:hypothetical protein